MIFISPIAVTDAVLISANVAEPSGSDPAAWSSAVTYAIGAKVRVVGTDSHKIYQSLQGSNLNHTPGLTTPDLWWIYVGPTNRWNLFDQSITSQATNATTIDVTLRPDGRANAVAILNVSAGYAQVIMTDTATGTEVYNKTVNLASDSGITDWHSYFFSPISRKEDIVFSDLPPYANPTIRIILSETTMGIIVKAGAIIIGQKTEVGGTQYGAKVGIQDYSIKTQDIYGNYQVLQRAFRKTASFSVLVSGSYVDQLHKLLTDLRSVPIVYAGSDDYTSTIIYGFYKDFGITIAYPAESICSLDIEGLT